MESCDVEETARLDTNGLWGRLGDLNPSPAAAVFSRSQGVTPLSPGVIRAAVTTTQIAPTILELLNLDPTALQAVKLEGTAVLAGIKSDNGKSPH
jgi:hypothetical protein